MKSAASQKFARLLCVAGLILTLPVFVAKSETPRIQKISLPMPPDMSRADLYYLPTVENSGKADVSKVPNAAPSSFASPHPSHDTPTPTRYPVAVLVLCPGANGNGEALIRQHVWQDFARRNRLGLVGLSFASDGAFLNDGGRGYYYASKGSGQALLGGLRQIYGRDLPLLLYGFSGGAHFTSRFTEWAPQHVLAWCAYSAAWWDTPRRADCTPPGIVACGENDPRYGASLIYFKQGRAAGKPWLWVSLANTGHGTSPALEEFVRHYFEVILHESVAQCAKQVETIVESKNSRGLWLDVDFKTIITPAQAAQHPALSAWLPAQELLEKWLLIHKP